MTGVGRRARCALGAVLLYCAAVPPAHAADRFDETIAAAKAAMQSRPERGIVLARDAREQADRSPAKIRSLRQAQVDWLQGEGYSRLSRYELARPLVERALRQAKAAAPRTLLVADILLLHGTVALDAGEVGTALEDFQRAYRLYGLGGNARGQAKALIEIAQLHHEANDPSNALKYFERAGELVANDPGLALSIHNGRGNELRDTGRFRESLRELELAVSLTRDMGSPLLTGTVLYNAARTAVMMRNMGEATRLLDESERVTGPRPPAGVRTQQLSIRAEIETASGRPAAAAALLDRIFAGVDLTRTTLADRDAHRVAVDVYRKLGRSELALGHLTAWKRLDDDATAIARSYGAALVGARFDFANQAARIARLKALDLQKTVAFERARAQTQRAIFLGSAGGGAAIVALLVFFLLSIRRSRDRLARSNLALGKALAAKTEFLATTSHEIRTPLNGILGMTQVMLADRTLPAGARDRVSLVHAAGTTMRALVDDILDTAKIESGGLAIEQVPFDLCGTITDACRMWEEQARAKGLDFRIELADCPARIVGDAARVRQVIFNLLANAVKFTPNGAITVTAAQCGARFRVTVADTGIGIAADKLETVFESFAQEDTTTTRRFGGTGLGLSICRSLARAMGGDVTVASERGAGSRFTLELPLRTAQDEVATTAAAPCSLLVIEANPITRAMLRTLFTAAGDSVAVAASLEEGCERLRAAAAEIVLIDRAMLPTDAALALLVTAKGSARLCVTTAEPDTGSRGGIDRIITKPLSREALVAAVRRTEPAALESRAA